MVITRISEFGIKLTQGSMSIALNPAVDKKNLSQGTFSADIILLSSPDIGFDGDDLFTKKDGGTFVISSAGEYERDELFIYGFETSTEFMGHNSTNTTYYFNLDSIDVLVLGAHEPDNLPNELTELVDNVDILIVPIAGGGTLGPIAANKLATKLEASVVIPVGYTKKDDEQLKAFHEEFNHKITQVDKLTLKSSDIATTPEAYIIL